VDTRIPLDKGFCEAFRSYARDCIPLLESAARQPFGYLAERLVVSTRPGSVQVEPAAIPDWARIARNNERQLLSVESYRELLQLLRDDSRATAYANRVLHRNDGKPLTEEDLSKFFDWHVIRRFLLNYLDGQGSSFFDEARFSQVYGSLEELLLTNSQTIRAVAMLFSFLGPEDPIKVDEEITIRRATDADLSELINRTGRPPEEIGVGNRMWLIEIESHVADNIGPSNPTAGTQVERVLGAMRLTKMGGVCCSYLYSTRKYDNSASTLMNFPLAHIGFSSDFTAREDVNEFLRLFRALRALEPTSSLSFGIRRFNYAYERMRMEDRLIDLMIVLESLFVEDGKAGEIAYKFRMRIARFLYESGNLDDRRKCRDIAKAAYEMRSSIVHGDTRKQAELLNKVGTVQRIW
jgi:hypothetical protein